MLNAQLAWTRCYKYELELDKFIAKRGCFALLIKIQHWHKKMLSYYINIFKPLASLSN